MFDDLDILILQTFAINLKKFRLKNKLSQSQLAFEVGLSLRQIQRIEKAEFRTNIVVLYKICESLNVEMKDLFDFEIEN